MVWVEMILIFFSIFYNLLQTNIYIEFLVDSSLSNLNLRIKKTRIVKKIRLTKVGNKHTKKLTGEANKSVLKE